MKDNGSDNSEPLLKKRRKAPTTPNSTPPKPVKVEDMATSVCEWEEKEAAARDPNEDRKMYHDTCNSFKSFVDEIAVLKKKGTPEAKLIISEKCSEASLLFVMLRKLNRLEKLRLKQSRDEVHRVKGQVDSQHLQLQNLLYEVLHLQKEVTKCFQFKSQDEEIDLVPLEEFLRDAPPSFKKSAKEQDNHQLKKARLEWELQQRRQLAERCKQMLEDKEKVLKDIEKQQQHLENLAPMLRNILKATKPVEESLGAKVEATRQQHQMAYLLPQPLFFLYVHSDAQKQASDPLLSVTIEGDEDEARRFKQGVNEVNDVDDSDSDQELEVESNEKSKRHHRKRSNKVDRQEERRKRLLSKHPLHVNLIVGLNDGNKLNLEFYYLTNLNVITVKCSVDLSKPISGLFANQLMTPDSILSSLYPGDTGLESPNMANHYQLQNVGLGPFSDLTSQLGYAYIWTQQVGGLDFISPNQIEKAGSSSERLARNEISKTSIAKAIAALRQRFKARLALCHQVQTLETGWIPLIPALRGCFPTKLNAQLSDFKQISWPEYRAHKSTLWLIEQQQVGELDFVYHLIITRGPARLSAFIAIKSNYPVSPPIFSIEVLWKGQHTAADCDAIRDMEREVNVYFKELMVGTGWAQTLLIAQVTRLIYCFDVFLEASSETDEDKRSFPKDKVFIQAVRGRTQALPYKYLESGSSIFTQR